MSHPPKATGRLRKSHILVLDDEVANLRSLGRLLGWAGYRRVETFSDPRLGVEAVKAQDPDLLLLDLHMPGMTGFDVLEALAGRGQGSRFLPVLVLTGDTSEEVRNRALAMGARDFVNKPFQAAEVLLRIKNLLETRHLHRDLHRQNEFLEDRVEARTQALAAAQLEILDRLALAAEYRDDQTGQHAQRVGLLSALLGRESGMAEREVGLLRRAATLHDVGKIGIPDAILGKPGPLTDEEMAVMRSHVDIGERILAGGNFPLLQMARVIAGHHHERWNGTGYRGLEGEAIPFEGRLVAVADAYDVITSSRPYVEARTHEEALRVIESAAGLHFDPQVVQALFRLESRGVLRGVRARCGEPHGPGPEGAAGDPPVNRGLRLPAPGRDRWVGSARGPFPPP